MLLEFFDIQLPLMIVFKNLVILKYDFQQQ